MLATEENYRGINFVRISSLPTEQKKKIRQTVSHDLIIKIKKGDSLLTDCIQYNHYVSWYENNFRVERESKLAEVELSILNNLAIAS